MDADKAAIEAYLKDRRHDASPIPGVLDAEPGWDHNWPPDLDGDAKCEWCGLSYSEWSDPETLWCQVGPQ